MPVENLTLRIDKGTELTFAECDGNFEKLRDFCDALEERVDIAITQDGELRDAKVGYFADNGGTDAYTATIPGTYATIDDLRGVIILGLMNTSNDGAATLVVNGFAAKAIVKDHGQVLDVADIQVSKIAAFTYNGTNYQLLNPRSSGTVNYGADAGSADAYKVEFTDLAAAAASRFQFPAAIYAGYRVSFKAANDNTGTSTFEVKLVTPSISLSGTIRNGTSVLISKEIRAGVIYDVIWDGTYWQLQNSLASGANFYTASSPTGNLSLASPYKHTFPHGLGVIPRRVKVVCVCTSADANYSVNDEADLSAFQNTLNQQVIGFSVDATNIIVHQRQNSGFEIFDKTSASYSAVDETKWTPKVYAER